MDSLWQVELFEVPFAFIGLWIAAGVLAGFFVLGRRPLGILGDLIIGVIGGGVAGWVASKSDIMFADFIDGVDQSTARYIGEFVTALIGAFVVVLLVRVVYARKPAS